MDLLHSRRRFLGQTASSLGLLFVSALTPDLLQQAHAYSQSARKDNDHQFRFLTAQEAADFEAFAAQIIPTDDTPGAREAGVVYFADYVLDGISKDQQKGFRQALASLQEATAETVPGTISFAALTPEQQVTVMKNMEKAQASGGDARLNQRRANRPEAFGLLRATVLTGCFCDPSLGGNKNKVGWKLIGFDDQAYWAPPFGYYDAHSEDKA